MEILNIATICKAGTPLLFSGGKLYNEYLAINYYAVRKDMLNESMSEKTRNRYGNI